MTVQVYGATQPLEPVKSRPPHCAHWPLVPPPPVEVDEAGGWEVVVRVEVVEVLMVVEAGGAFDCQY